MQNKEPFRLKYAAYIPAEAFNLPDKYFKIYAVINAVIGGEENGYCWLTDEELSQATDKGESTIRRALNELEAKDLIWRDTDQKRTYLRNGTNKERAIRRIYTNYKYYVNRNKKPTLPKNFKNKYSFRNYLKTIGFTYEFKVNYDSRVIPLKITDKALLLHTGTNKYLDKNDDKTLIDKVWTHIYEQREEIIKKIKENE